MKINDLIRDFSERPNRLVNLGPGGHAGEEPGYFDLARFFLTS
jgi:hypothetical protein